MSTAARTTRHAGEAADAPASDMIDLLGLVRIFWRRKLLIGTLVVLGTVGAYLFGKNMTPEYTAKAVVLIDPQDNPVLDLKAVLTGLTTEGAGINTEIKMFSSRTFVARVMDELKLFDDPEFNPALRPASPCPSAA